MVFLREPCTRLGTCLHYTFKAKQMQREKRHLKIIQQNEKHAEPVKGTTCFSVHEQYSVDCNRKGCQNWIAHPEKQNCVLIAAHDGPYTLQKIGQIYNVSRMRICQMEKEIFEKIRAVSC